MSDAASTPAAGSQNTLPSEPTRIRTTSGPSADGFANEVAAANRGRDSISLALTDASDLTDLGLGSTIGGSASAFGRSSFSSSSKAQSAAIIGVVHVSGSNTNTINGERGDTSSLLLGGGVMNNFFMGVGGGESHRRGSSLSSSPLSPRTEGVSHVSKAQATSRSLRRASSASASSRSPLGNTGLSPLRQLQLQRRRRGSSSTVSLSIGGQNKMGENELGGGSITFDNSGFLFSGLGLMPYTPALPSIGGAGTEQKGAAALLSPFPPLEAIAPQLSKKGSEGPHLEGEEEEVRRNAVRRVSRTLPFRGASPENSDQSWDSGHKETQIETPAITVTTPQRLGIMEGLEGKRDGERDFHERTYNREELQQWKGHDKKEADEGTTPLGGALGTKSKKSPSSRAQVSPKHLAAMAPLSSPAASSSSYFSSPFSPSLLLDSLDLDTDVDKLGIYELESLMTTLNKSLPPPPPSLPRPLASTEAEAANPQPAPSEAQETSISTQQLLQSKRASVQKRLSLLKAAPTEIEAQHKKPQGSDTNEMEIRSDADSNLLHANTVGSDGKGASDVKKTDEGGIAIPPSTEGGPVEPNTHSDLDSGRKGDNIASSDKKEDRKNAATDEGVHARVSSDRAVIHEKEEKPLSSDSHVVEQQPTATEQPTAMQLIWERLQKKRDEEAKKEIPHAVAPSDEQKAIPVSATKPEAVTIIIKRKDGTQTVINNQSNGAMLPAVTDNTANTREEGNETTTATTTHANNAISAVSPSQNPPPSAENVTNSLPTAPAAAAAKRSQSLRYFTSKDKGQPQQMETRTITTTIVTNGVPTVRQIQVQVPVAPLQPKITKKSYVVSTLKPSVVPRPSSFAGAGHANGSGAVEGASSSSATAGREDNNDGHVGGNTHNKKSTEIITPAVVGTTKATSENAVNSTLVTAVGSTAKEQAIANNEKRAEGKKSVGDNTKSAKLGEALGIGAGWMEDLADFVSVLRSDQKEEGKGGNVGEKEAATTEQLQLLKKARQGEKIAPPSTSSVPQLSMSGAGTGKVSPNIINAGGSDAFTTSKPTRLASKAKAGGEATVPTAVRSTTPKKAPARPTATDRDGEDHKSALKKPATVIIGGYNNDDDDELSDFDVSGCSTPPVRPLNLVANVAKAREPPNTQSNPTPPITGKQLKEEKEEVKEGLEQRRPSAAAAVKPLVVCDVLLTAQDASLTPPNDFAMRREMALLNLVSPPARPLPSFPKLESPKKEIRKVQRGPPPPPQPSKHRILENKADGKDTKVEKVPLPPPTATIADVNNKDRGGIKVKTPPAKTEKIKETKAEPPRAHEGTFQVSSPHPPADPPTAGKQRPVSPGLLVPTVAEPTASGKTKEESRVSPEVVRVPAAASATRPRTLFSPHSPDVSVVGPTGGEARRARYPTADLPDAVPPERSLFKPDVCTVVNDNVNAAVSIASPPACNSEGKRIDAVGQSPIEDPPKLISEKAAGLSDSTEKTNSPPDRHELLTLRKETLMPKRVPCDYTLEEGSSRGNGKEVAESPGDVSESRKEQPPAANGPPAAFRDESNEKENGMGSNSPSSIKVEDTERSPKRVKRTISDATAVVLQRAFAERYPGMPVPLSLVKWFVSANSGALMNLRKPSNANLSSSGRRGDPVSVGNQEESQGVPGSLSSALTSRKSSHRASTLCSGSSSTTVGDMNSAEEEDTDAADQTNENPNDPNSDLANSEEAIINPFFDTYLKFAAATKSAEENAKRLSFAVRRRTETVLQSTSSSEAEQGSARGRSFNSEKVGGTSIRWVDDKTSLGTHQKRGAGSFTSGSNQSASGRGSIFTHAFELSPSSPLAPEDQSKAAFPSNNAAEASAARALRSDRGSIGTAPPLGFGKVGMTFASVAAEERRTSSSGGASTIANPSSAILEFGPLLRSHSGSRRSTESGSDRSVGRTGMKKNSDDFHYQDPALDVVRTQEDSPRFAGGPQQHTTASPMMGNDNANGFTLRTRARSSTATLLGGIASPNSASAASPAFVRGYSFSSRSLATPDKPSPLAPPPPPAVENLDVPLPQEHSSGQQGQKEQENPTRERPPPAEYKEDVKPVLVGADRKLSSPTENEGGGAAKEGAAVGLGFTAAPLARRRLRRKPSVVFLGTMSQGPHFEEVQTEGEERDGAICTITAAKSEGPAAQSTDASQPVGDIVGNEKEAITVPTFLRSRSIMSTAKLQSTNKLGGGGGEEKSSKAVFEDNGRTRQASTYGWSDAERDMRAEREALATPRGEEKGENTNDPKEADFISLATNADALSSQAGGNHDNVDNGVDGRAFNHPYAIDTDAFPTPAQQALQPLVVAVPVCEDVCAKEDPQHPPRLSDADAFPTPTSLQQEGRAWGSSRLHHHHHQAFSLESPGDGKGSASQIIHHDQNAEMNAVHDAPLSPLPPQEGHSSHLRARFYPQTNGTSGPVDRLRLDKSLDGDGDEVRGEHPDHDSARRMPLVAGGSCSPKSDVASQHVGASVVRVSPETEMVLFQGVWMSAAEKHRRLEASRQRNEYFKQLAIEYLETHRGEGVDSKALDRLF